jgi:hypothetical protein
MNKSFDYIRQHYDVPAEEGRRVEFQGQPGTIINAWGAHLTIQLDGKKLPSTYHPTWGLEYLDEVQGK